MTADHETGKGAARWNTNTTQCMILSVSAVVGNRETGMIEGKIVMSD